MMDGLFAALVGLVLGVPSVVIAWLSVDHTRALLMLAGAAVAHVALAWRRSRPLASGAVIGGVVLAMLLVWQWFVLLPSGLVALVSIYAGAAYARRVRPALVLGLSVGGCLLVGVRYTIAPPAPIPGAALLLAALLTAGVVAAWSLGLVRRSQLAHVGLLEQRLRDAAAERERRAQAARAAERARIARDVHDVVAHSLAVIVNQAKGGQYLDPAAGDRVRDVLRSIEDTSRSSLTELRGLVGLLGDDSADRRPQPGLERLPELVDRVRDTGRAVTLAEVGQHGTLGPSGELAVFRVVQESLTNVMKHSATTAQVWVRLEWTPGALELSVTDSGPAAPMANDDGAGAGIAGMRDRLAILGGCLDAGPLPGGGFRVVARVRGEA
jgi:signal transduction histidine kinase